VSRGGGSARGYDGPLADRLPPQNLVAECGVLGSVLLDNTALHEVVPFLKAEDFYRDAHQVLYRAVRDLYNAGKAVDAITLAEELTRRDEIRAVGGIEFIAEVVNAVPHSANAMYYAGIVREKALARRVIDAANETLREAYANEKPAGEVLAAAEARVLALSDGTPGSRSVPASEAATAAMDRVIARSEGAVGMPTCWRALNDVVCGFEPEQLVIIAGRPSMGKSAAAQVLAEFVCRILRRHVLLVSCEMSAADVMERYLVMRSGIDSKTLRRPPSGGLEGEAIARLTEAYDYARSLPMTVDDTPSRTVPEVHAEARRLAHRLRDSDRPLGLVVVDYLQLLEPEDGGAPRHEQIAVMSRRLKVMARDLRVPVVALSQLNRKVEDRPDKRPHLSDLRESGAIEQDADIVLLMHRPEYYDAADRPGVAEVIVAKNRNGETGCVPLSWRGATYALEDVPEAVPAAGPDGAGGGAF
jgi:replicative DNA helicase